MTTAAGGAQNRYFTYDFASSITYHPNGTVNDVTFADAAHWIQDRDPYSMSRPSRFRTTNTGANWDSGLGEVLWLPI